MINRFCILLVRILLWFRYRVRLAGLDDVAHKGRTGILFLPNHPALIDPVILLSHLMRHFRVRALADRNQIDRYLIRRLARRFRIIPIPDLARSEAGSSDLGTQVEELSREVRRLKEENREIRGMLEGIAAAAGSQIDILRVMREGLARGESTEPSADDQSGRGKG